MTLDRGYPSDSECVSQQDVVVHKIPSLCNTAAVNEGAAIACGSKPFCFLSLLLGSHWMEALGERVTRTKIVAASNLFDQARNNRSGGDDVSRDG